MIREDLGLNSAPWVGFVPHRGRGRDEDMSAVPPVWSRRIADQNPMAVDACSPRSGGTTMVARPYGDHSESGLASPMTTQLDYDISPVRFVAGSRRYDAPALPRIAAPQCA